MHSPEVEMQMNLADSKIAIIGAGPTGLGVAWRLQELGLNDWTLFEKESYAGGLAASFHDTSGFTWDAGGHVLFSHYSNFDGLIERLLGDGWLKHERESWIWMRERFIRYRFRITSATCRNRR